MATTIGHYLELELRAHVAAPGRLARLRALLNAPGAVRERVAATLAAEWGGNWEPADAPNVARGLAEIAAEP
jgi:hypothetical protein